jgi:hypothetical protein
MSVDSDAEAKFASNGDSAEKFRGIEGRRRKVVCQPGLGNQPQGLRVEELRQQQSKMKASSFKYTLASLVLENRLCFPFELKRSGRVNPFHKRRFVKICLRCF